MTDPNFNDLKLFTEGPQSDMELEQAIPELEPAVIGAPGTFKTKPTPTTIPTIPLIEPSASKAPELTPVSIELSDANEKGSE